MSYLLDILGATAIGAYVIYMIMQVNIRITESSSEIFLSALSQNNSLTAAEIIQYDFYKIGYRANSPILEADSTTIKFLADLERDWAIDTISYYEGNESDLSTSSNPNDKPLYRQVNDSGSSMISPVASFKIVYYDSIGNKIDYKSLQLQSYRNKVKFLKLNIRYEASDPIDGYYRGLDYVRTIRPRNL